MKCPHCGHGKTRVTETRDRGDADLRIRICRGCGRTFQTLEQVCVFAGKAAGYLVAEVPDAGEPPPPLALVPPAPVVITPPEPQPEPVAAEAPAAPAAGRMTRFMPSVEDLPDAICLDAAPLLLSWWCEARRSKHQGRATWTRAAWQASADRVAQLPDAQQLALCQAGNEHGWQALKPEYLAGSGPATPAPAVVAAGRLMPKDPAMLAALNEWPEIA